MPVEECLCPGTDACAHAVFYTQTDRQLEKKCIWPHKGIKMKVMSISETHINYRLNKLTRHMAFSIVLQELSQKYSLLQLSVIV